MSDLITDGCEPSYGCWDFNSESSEEQSVLLTAEPSRQPYTFIYFFMVLELYCRKAGRKREDRKRERGWPWPRGERRGREREKKG